MLQPELINPSLLPSMPLEWRKALPECPAIYFAIDADNQIQYIGQSGNLQLRWEYHHRQKQLELMNGVVIAWLTIDSLDLLAEIEAALINWFNPPLNLIKPRLEEVPEKCKNIEHLRTKANLTQRQVAEALGKTDQTVSNWENGVRSPKLTPSETLILCRVLKCTLEELAGETEGITKS
ncbi:helix-turn-helix domain-containing protein [Nostoc sp. CHAB 5824]|nr:helix-turn-helix domain-containing protein [Nostoc sp. CHAB 5824]